MIPYAPEDPLGEDFSTRTMNIIDAILSRIGLDDDGLGPNWSSTERIVHKFHMIDVWHRVKEVFQEVEQNPPQVLSSAIVCPQTHLTGRRQCRLTLKSSVLFSVLTLDVNVCSIKTAIAREVLSCGVTVEAKGSSFLGVWF